METQTASPLMCSKCEKNPRADQDSSNPWCLACRATYQRDYVKKIKSQTAEQAFARGVAATKALFAGEFSRLGIGQFTGFDVAALIQNAPGPKFEA
ncbi:MAG TPA: hypothetical protein VNH83_20195 [Bryobacteraceae bacterium]|nr:hypothetical protein [Bryobacteraceae bacterium]